MEANRMLMGDVEFAMECGSFRRITAAWSGPGWDFSFRGKCIGGEYDLSHGWIGLYCEAAPLPIEKAADYRKIEIDLPGYYDEESGEPCFAIDIGESFDVGDVRLRFVDRADDRYLIELRGTVSEEAFGNPIPLHLLAWAVEGPDHSYLQTPDNSSYTDESDGEPSVGP